MAREDPSAAGAEQFLAGLRREVVVAEAVGILRVWRQCGQLQAESGLATGRADVEEESEARRMAEVVDADGHGDPDAEWD